MDDLANLPGRSGGRVPRGNDAGLCGPQRLAAQLLPLFRRLPDLEEDMGNPAAPQRGDTCLWKARKLGLRHRYISLVLSCMGLSCQPCSLGGALIVAAPQYIVNSGIADAGGAGVVASSFGVGLVTANLAGFHLSRICPTSSMFMLTAVLGLAGVLSGGLLTVAGKPFAGMLLAAFLVGCAQSLHVLARTFYQAEVVKEQLVGNSETAEAAPMLVETRGSLQDGQAFVSGWVSASNILGIAIAALVTAQVDCAGATNLGLLCTTGILLYSFLLLLLSATGSTSSSTARLEAKEEAEHEEELAQEGDFFRMWHFWKVCFLIFTMAIAREAQKFLIPLIGAEHGLHTSFVGHVAFMSQMESLATAQVGGFLMESFGIFPVVLVSLLLSAVGIQFHCLHGIRFYVQGASLLGLGCGLCAGAAIALSIQYAPKNPSQKRLFLNGSRFFNSSADVLLPLVVGFVVSAEGTLLVGTGLALCTLCSAAAALLSFLPSDSRSAESVQVPDMDFVIPLKAAGPFTRTVLEAIHVNYAPRKIHIICQPTVREATSKLMVEWSLPRGKVAFVDEETYFQKVMGLKRTDLKASFKGVGPRDFGWWWQQLLKLGAGQCIEGISENFCVWDADLIVLKPWPLLQKGKCFVAPHATRKPTSPARRKS